jgi:hypothetical protein
MNVLIACEYSGAMRAAFHKRGHFAVSCDLLPSEEPRYGFNPWHYQGNIREILERRVRPFYRRLNDIRWDLMIAHPSCTYLTRAGYHWCNAPDSAELPLKGEPRRFAMREAAGFFRYLLDADIPKIAIENPIPICHAGLPPATQIVQPWHFGVPQFKATCWWTKGLPKLERMNELVPPVRGTDEHKAWSTIHRMPPGKDRWKERSRTDPRVAAAIAAQWG